MSGAERRKELGKAERDRTVDAGGIVFVPAEIRRADQIEGRDCVLVRCRAPASGGWHYFWVDRREIRSAV